MKTNQDEKPLVSVIIPTYNRLEWIGECLDSVLAQTYPKIEIIVIDDGSSDGTAQWIRGQEKYSRVIVREQKNSGASNARNNAIKIARGELVVFIDSDDLLLPRHVETAVEKFAEIPDLGLFCCDSTMIDSEGNVLFDGKTWHQNLSEMKNLEVKTGFRSLEDVFMFSNCFPGFTLKREVFDRLGGFIQEIFPGDDYDLALRVAGSEYKVFYLHESLCLRREHDGQCSGIQNSVKTCLKLTEALQKALKENPEQLKDKSKIRRRLAELEFEKGVSQMKEGNNSEGLKTMLGSVIKSPQQFGKIARIGGRKIMRGIKSDQ